MTEPSFSYSVSTSPISHLVHVTLTVRGSLSEPLIVAMPVWTPGSYLVREYARHVENLRARTAAGSVGVRRTAKDRWAIAHGHASEVVIEYSVYAHELTVRTNHVCDTHAFWNGAATFVRPVEANGTWDSLPVDVTIHAPDPHWRIATSLERTSGPSTDGSSRFRARSFDELVDSPVEMGVHERLDFSVGGRPHAVVIWGAPARFDRPRLIENLTAIIEYQSRLFGEVPYDDYLFILHLAPSGRGGLEHAASTTLLASPDAFDTPESYDDLLSLFAHELFHLWHVKRTRPAGLATYDYAHENYTRLLWLFEGGTSYYDWLTLRRTSLVDARAYLKHLASEIARLEETPGRFAQSLEEASYDAWVKLYRPDEHSVNSTVSYYLKGEIVCALLDLELRVRSRGAKSFDDVMKYLWAEHGRVGRAVSESAVESVFAAATGIDVSDVIDSLVRSRGAISYDRTLASVGLALKPRAGRGASLGVRLRAEHGRAVLASVLRSSPAEQAGLAPGDEIVAIDQRRVDDSSLRERLRHRKAGEQLEVLYARRDRMATTNVVLADAPPETYELVGVPEATPEARALGEAWLGSGASSVWSAR